MRFRDRRDAGRALARELVRFAGEAPVVLALPRGGVVVGAEVASALRAPLDVLVVRKIPAPLSPELALGAVCEMGGEQVHLDPRTLRETGAAEEYVRAEARRQLDEVRRREAIYRAGRAAVPIAGRTVIVVDDGVATGSTALVALRAARRAGAARVVLAVPVASPESVRALGRDADEVVALAVPIGFYAVGQYYDDFSQTTDDEVVRLLAESGSRPPA
ncbi:MAG: phosphoribosyltransferase [Leptolyngbya sp. PLA2]|nr:phosphoribosyltransferase [Leptolyngbya sp.]MCE7971755.1 phosphoribosyltransferase [Leptolyngbya sp. PL-A2]MCZ7634395.1 phosphoribosyltransferase family protein [Phycisphaerales bacterium]MDL1904807.1 phosphoribosyltransferase [Synechococcales cyanobacterium CNB]GIK19711.1 MAG: hypothetical protein BroJett004_18750 [Planctomycetota bacterium]